MSITVLPRARMSRRVACLLVCLAWIGPAAVPAFAQVPAKGTEIRWDRYGIPHVSAPDQASLFYAYGYAQTLADICSGRRRCRWSDSSPSYCMGSPR